MVDNDHGGYPEKRTAVRRNSAPAVYGWIPGNSSTLDIASRRRSAHEFAVTALPRLQCRCRHPAGSLALGAPWEIPAVAAALTIVGISDLLQTKRALRRNYPIMAHFRFFFESIRPEIRQYFLEDDTVAEPFSRNQRSIVYQRAKLDTDKRPFGTQLDVYAPGYEWINHSIAPAPEQHHDFRIEIGNHPDCPRAQPYSASVFNISAMSFGALSANAIKALNGGAKQGGFMHDTGEGSISPHHRENGGDLIWEIGSGYFGCRNDDGTSRKSASPPTPPRRRSR
jgi:glutamate synthase domain-containing protein 2